MRKVSRSRTVIGRFAGTVSSSGPSSRFNTLRSASSGSQRSTGSSSRSLHSSTRIIVATAMIGLVIEEMRKMVSRRMGGASADRLRPDHINMHLAPPADQRDETRHFAALDIAGHDLVHAAEPRPGQSSGAHYLFPPFCLICMVLLVFCNHAVHCFQYT